MERPLRIALVSREVYPLVLGGGLGRYVTATAETLAEIAEVTIFTTDLTEERYHELVAQGSHELPPGIRWVFVAEPRPREIGAFYHHLHCWSARVLDALRREYADQPPDLVEFPDYLGEGCVTVQAKQTLDPLVRRAAVCLRLYTPSEMTCVLNGHVPGDDGMGNLFELERHALRFCDRIVAPGGDVYDSYRRFYGADRVAPALEVHHPVLADPVPDAPPTPHDGPLRLAYLGRMERRKGVQALLRALTGLSSPDWEITLVGGDTRTGPLGVSAREHVELGINGDARVTLRERVGREEVVALFQQADLAVFPSRWECWPNVALEALQRDCPVLATPTGGYLGLVDHGTTGWLARGTDDAALARALEPHVLDPGRSRAVRSSGAGSAAFARLTDRTVVRERYLRLIDEEAARHAPRPRPRSEAPLVSVVIPYFRMEEFVEETVRSLLDQTYRPLELVLVNDGSLRATDRILDALAEAYPLRIVTQQNSGLGAARNLGIAQSRGRYVYPMDPDDLVEPGFVERCVEVLESRPELAYVTSWSHFVDEHGVELGPPEGAYYPLGNTAGILHRVNASGSAEAVFRRSVFDAGHWYSTEMTSYEDWLHYRELAAAGLHGAIVPEPLLRYRVRRDSMVRTIAWSRHARLLGEMEAHLREGAMTWTSASA
ncbi:MAG: glycosyltransferase [Thermoleophilia bacterium]